MPKTMRSTLAGEIDLLFRNLIKCLVIASYRNAAKKLSHLEEAATELDLLKAFLQIAWETQALTTTKYTVLATPLEEVGKMLGGWIRQVKENPASGRE